jgi:hypothetical protein
MAIFFCVTPRPRYAAQSHLLLLFIYTDIRKFGESLYRRHDLGTPLAIEIGFSILRFFDTHAAPTAGFSSS